MLDHVTIGVTDLDRARRFYAAALAPLGIAELMHLPDRFAGFGPAHGRVPGFWIGVRPVVDTPAHVAFTAIDRATVDAFHAAALVAGGRDHGGPGVRAHYHAHYYGAFVLDPDGHNIEAVCRTVPPVSDPT